MKEKDQWERRLDFLDTSADTVTEDMILESLAHIVADIYIAGQKKKGVDKST